MPPQLDLQLVEAALEHICRTDGDGGAVLVFLTGWDDITLLTRRLERNALLGDPNRHAVLGGPNVHDVLCGAARPPDSRRCGPRPIMHAVAGLGGWTLRAHCTVG